jgi:hypothetical protein
MRRSPGCWARELPARPRATSMVRLARAATGIGLPELPTRAQQAGLRLEDVPRPSLGRILRRNRLDAKIRRALGRALRRRRPKD